MDEKIVTEANLINVLLGIWGELEFDMNNFVGVNTQKYKEMEKKLHDQRAYLLKELNIARGGRAGGGMETIAQIAIRVADFTRAIRIGTRGLTYDEIPEEERGNIRTLLGPQTGTEQVRFINDAWQQQVGEGRYYNVEGYYYFIPNKITRLDENGNLANIIRYESALVRTSASLIALFLENYTTEYANVPGRVYTNDIPDPDELVTIIMNRLYPTGDAQEETGNYVKSAATNQIRPVIDTPNPAPPDANSRLLEYRQVEGGFADANFLEQEFERGEDNVMNQQRIYENMAALQAANQLEDPVVQQEGLRVNQFIFDEEVALNIGAKGDIDPIPPMNNNIQNPHEDINTARAAIDALKAEERLYNLVNGEFTIEGREAVINLQRAYINALGGDAGIVDDEFINSTINPLINNFLQQPRGIQNVMPEPASVFNQVINSYALKALMGSILTTAASTALIYVVTHTIPNALSRNDWYNYVYAAIVTKYEQVLSGLGMLNNSVTFYARKHLVGGNRYDFWVSQERIEQMEAESLSRQKMRDFIIEGEWVGDKVVDISDSAVFDAYRYSVITNVVSTAMDMNNTDVPQPTYEIKDEEDLCIAITGAIKNPGTDINVILAEKIRSWTRNHKEAIENHVLNPYSGSDPPDPDDEPEDDGDNGNPSNIPKLPIDKVGNAKVYTEEGYRYILSSMTYFITKYTAVTIASMTLGAYISCKIINSTLGSLGLPIPEISIRTCDALEKLLFSALEVLGMAADTIKNLVATINNLSIASATITSGVGGIVILGLLAGLGVYMLTKK